jgi:hypothetical protein
MKQESQQVQTEQEKRLALFSMCEIMFKMIDFGFQDIVVVIFDFLARVHGA